jgi:hypothetical protein
VIIIIEWVNNAEFTNPAWEKCFEMLVASDGMQLATLLCKGLEM